MENEKKNVIRRTETWISAKIANIAMHGLLSALFSIKRRQLIWRRSVAIKTRYLRIIFSSFLNRSSSQMGKKLLRIVSDKYFRNIFSYEEKKGKNHLHLFKKVWSFTNLKVWILSPICT